MTATIKKLVFVALYFFLAIFIFASTAFSRAVAAEVQATANVRITEAISLSEIQRVEFGSVASGLGQCTMNQFAELSAPNGLCAGYGTLGIIQVGGQAGSRINIVANSGSTEGITFYPQLSQSSFFIDNSDDAVQVPVAGSLELSTSLNGQHNIPYEITANYE